MANHRPTKWMTLTVLSLAFYARLYATKAEEIGQRVDTPIEHFSSNDKTVPATLRTLANQAHLPIGVSGFVPVNNSSDEKTISINVEHRSLRQILDELCRQDPNYSWEQFSDEGIHVKRGARPMTLIDVKLGSLTINANTSANNLLSLFLLRSEIKHWEQDNCRIYHPMIFIGNSSRPDTLVLPQIESRGEPLWELFDELSLKSGRYFWSAIGSAGTPCFVDVDILSAE